MDLKIKLSLFYFQALFQLCTVLCLIDGQAPATSIYPSANRNRDAGLSLNSYTALVYSLIVARKKLACTMGY